jgi:signal transduction histidine kinase
LQAESIQKEEVDLPTLLLDTAERLKPFAEKKGAELVCALTPCTVMGDGILLSLLVDNLAENALKAGSTKVTLACDAGKITVTDDGRGLTEEQLAQITKPFYRTDKNRSRTEGGAGLGLALCKQIVDSHGGELSFSSEYEKGTTVTVILKKE